MARGRWWNAGCAPEGALDAAEMHRRMTHRNAGACALARRRCHLGSGEVWNAPRLSGRRTRRHQSA
eukprot:6396905-Pyramimonas_sp.AAC.1